MTQTKNDVVAIWPTTPWLGESASAQLELWRAGLQWAALSNSLLSEFDQQKVNQPVSFSVPIKKEVLPDQKR